MERISPVDIDKIQEMDEGTEIVVQNKVCTIGECKCCPTKFLKNNKTGSYRQRGNTRVKIRKTGSVTCSTGCSKINTQNKNRRKQVYLDKPQTI